MQDKKYELRKQIKSVRWMIFWVVLAQFAAEIVVEAIISFMENPPHEYIQIAIVEVLTIGVPITVYARSAWNSHGMDVKSEFWLNPCKPYLLVLAALLGICGQFVMILLNMPANILAPQPTSVPDGMNFGEFLFGIIAVVIIPAVLEEFWMRGIIFSAYNKSNTVAAVIFTSVLFALLHMRFNEILGFLFMGMVASIVLLKCKSLYAAICYHAFSNLAALILDGYIIPYAPEYIWIIFGIAIAVFPVFMFLLFINKSKIKNNKVFKTGGIVITSLISLPVLLSIAVVVARYFLDKFTG